MNEQKIAPVLSDDDVNELCWLTPNNDTRRANNDREMARAIEQAVLARVGAVRDLPATLPESMARDEVLVYYSQYANVCANEAIQYQKRIRDLESEIRALKDTPAAAVADGNDLRQPLRQHVAWIHSVMRETGHCIDGGVCHHNCRPKPEAPCFRQKGCLPLTGSRLNDDWTLPAPQSSGNPGPLAAVELPPMPRHSLTRIDHDTGESLQGYTADQMRKYARAAIAASKEGASHG